MKKRAYLFHFLFLFTWSHLCHADLTLPALISDNMVLQQGVGTKIWGWASSDSETVTLKFQGKEYYSLVKDGKWEIQLEKLNVGGPFEMELWGFNYIKISNILIGEVWLGSGQSNMMWKLENSYKGPQELAREHPDEIRFFVVQKDGSDLPNKDVQGQWRLCSSEDLKDFSAVQFFFGKSLYEEIQQPVGLILSGVGGTRICSWLAEGDLKKTSDADYYYNYYEEMCAEYPALFQAYIENKEKNPKLKAPQHPFRRMPSAYYNAMIAPIQNYAIKGVIWYQGETDSWFAEPYEELFEDLISSWRRDWKRGDFPFLYVQLASYDGKERVDENYPYIREAQLNILDKLPNTAMTVAIDLGEENDIHPRNKKSVGERLALAAKAKVYGKTVEFSGPIATHIEFKGNTAMVEFSHADGLQYTGEELLGFELAGEDLNFKPADAEILANKVILRSEAIKEVKQIRYGWGGFPGCNLYNAAKLPASPFRTDSVKRLSKEEWEAKNK